MIIPNIKTMQNIFDCGMFTYSTTILYWGINLLYANYIEDTRPMDSVLIMRKTKKYAKLGFAMTTGIYILALGSAIKGIKK